MTARDTRREKAWTASGRPLLRVRHPAMRGFASWTRTVSPVGNFMRWVDDQAGYTVHPDDVLVHQSSLTTLLEEQRRWLRRAFGLAGNRLSMAVNYTDLGGAPVAGSSVVAPGEVLIRLKDGAR